MLPVLAIASAVALGSSLVLGRQSKTLKRKPYSKGYLDAKFSSKSQRSSIGATGQAHKKNQPNRTNNKNQLSQDLYQSAKKIKRGIFAIQKVFAISLGGTQDRDKQLHQLTAHRSKNSINTANRKLDRKINISVGLIGLAATGSFFYSPLLVIAGVGTLINSLPVFQELSKNLKKGRITTELLEIVSQISFLLTGYYFLATVVSFIALLDIKLLKRTEEHSQQQLIDKFSQKSHSIWVIIDGTEVEMSLEAVRKNDLVIVNTGETIPVDGTVMEGIATIDQQSLTGESQPVEKENGATVFATTLVLTGRIVIQAEHTGSDTNAAKIGHVLEQTQDFKETLRLRGKKIADSFIAPTLLVSGLTLPFLGPSSALAILWSGFGYDMKLYGPISVLNFLHIMAKNGILIKDGRSLETLQKLDTVVFDKTGTLTVEQPKLGGIYPLDAYDEETLLTYAAAAEHRQSHPVAKAILSAAQQRDLELPTIEDAAYQVGYGIQVTVSGKLIQVGSVRLMQQKGIHIPAEVSAVQSQAHATGSSIVYVAVDDHLAGVLRLDPCVRPEAKRIVEYLKSEAITVLIISGDHKEPTRRLAHDLGVDGYYAETLPAQKAELIAKLRANGKYVGYVGDGINDAIALKGANVSISLSGASTIATDTAQIILMDGDLARIESLFEISKAFEKSMQANYRNSMIPGVITLSGVFFLHMGLIGALTIYFTSEAFSLMNCMMPLIKDEMSEEDVTWKLKDDTVKEPIDMTLCYLTESESKPESELVPDRV